MPGWHEKTKPWQQEGRFQMVGIVEEQHPDRARLFMQWKEMDWPILVDALDLLEVPYVPITLAIDEHGIIRYINPPFGGPDGLEDAFLNRDFPAPDEDAITGTPDPAGTLDHSGTPDPAGALDPTGTSVPAGPGDDSDAAGDASDASELDAEGWRSRAIDAFNENRLDDAVRAFGEAIRLEPDDGYTHFRLGVALHRRADSAGDPDFQASIEAWTAALEIDPNNYIWRRRIQQFGPRLDKPYPFYGWVETARAEISARGETPLELRIEPRGAELAGPMDADSGTSDSARDRARNAQGSDAGGTATGAGSDAEPDPKGEITRDPDHVEIRSAVVPHSDGLASGLLVHLVLRPRAEAHWNNETEDVVTWLEAPEGWRLDRGRREIPNPSSEVSTETRFTEYELRPETGTVARSLPAALEGHALYYICEDRNGVCLYRRQDFRVPVPEGVR